MLFKNCHITIIVLLVFQSCRADNPQTVHADLPQTPTLHDKNDTITSTTVSTIVSVATEKSTISPAPVKAVSSGQIITVPISVSTMKSDPDTTVPTTQSQKSTTVTSSLPTLPVSPTLSPNSSTSIQPTVTPHNPPTTNPLPTGSPQHSRQFDGPSFIGGIVLATGLMAIGFVAFKFYKARTERNYHTL